MKQVERLPDCYRKDEEGSNYKLLKINSLATDELKEDIRAVSDTLALDQASGSVLDLYGEMVGQARGLLNDDQYRYMILMCIGRNIVQGDYRSVMDALVLIFGCNQNDILLDDMEDEPCKVNITRFPLSVLTNAGFSSRQAIKMIELLLPACVTLSVDNFEGTFEFAEYDGEYDIVKGFGNIDQTVGGYMGLLLDEDFEGTFEFASYDREYDTETGFADTNQTMGGYFGYLLGYTNKISILPL